MTFKCNHCHRTIPFQHFGKPEIRCDCGARYTKTLKVELRDETPSNP